MTIPEEIEQLKTKLDLTTDEQEQAGILLEIIKKHVHIKQVDYKPYADRLLHLAEKMSSALYLAWALYFQAYIIGDNGDSELYIGLNQKALSFFEQAADTEGIGKACNCIGTFHLYKGNYPEAIKNYLRTIQIARERNDKYTIALTYNNISIIHTLTGEYQEALNANQKALRICVEIDDQPGIAAAYNNIGLTQNTLGNYAEGLKNLFQGLYIHDKLGDKLQTAAAHNNIGALHRAQGNFQEALKNQRKALQLQEEMGDKRTVSISIDSIGNIYYEQGNYTEAMKNYLRALQLRNELGDKHSIAISYEHIGNIHYKEDNYPRALENYLMALEIGKEIGDKRGIATYYDCIGNVYEKQGNHAEALRIKFLAMEIVEETANKNLLKHIYLSICDNYKTTGDFENALKYHEKYHQVQAEVLGEQAQKQLTSLNFQHNMEQKEKEAEIERLKNVELKEALDKLNLEKSRTEQLFQNQLQDIRSNALQAQMNPHFVFNSLNSIQQYIWEKNPEEATAYLTRFSKLIRLVLDNSRRQYVSLDQDLTALEYYIELESLRFENKFDYEVVCDPSIDKGGIQLPPMLIQPFVENAIIHGLQPLKADGKLTISLQRKDINLLHITIEDNGVGRFKAGQLKAGNERSHQSVAIQLTKERIQKMNVATFGEEAVVIRDLYDKNENPSGTKVEIDVPVEYD